MKQLILVRHAKSDWPEDTDDFHRPLAERGVVDANMMASYVKERDILIDRMISSPATRARDTALIFNKSFPVQLDTDMKLYHASENNFIAALSELPAEVNSVAVFSHNNGISNFANYISNEIFSFPTCGVAVFAVSAEDWSEFEGVHKKLKYFFEPKKLFRS